MLKNSKIVFFFFVFLLFPTVTINAQQNLPDWFSQVEQWVSKSLISQQEFDRALEYLIKNGIALEEHPDILHENENQKMTLHRQGYELVTDKEKALLPDCGDVVYTNSPIDLDKVMDITPLGNVDPPWHSIPTEHVYINTFMQGMQSNTIPLVAPANIWITHISVSYGNTMDHEDSSIHFAVCKDVSGYFNHIKELSQEMQQIIDDYQCPQGSAYDTQCPILVFEQIEAGTKLGEVGRLQGNFDFGTYDFRTQHDFINPDRYGVRSYHIQCPFDYYNDDMRTQFYSLISRNDGQCGKIFYDVARTAQGNWYYETARNDLPGDWGNSMFLGYDNHDPNLSVISVGGVFTEPLRWKFYAQDSGFLNTKFEEVTVDGNIYCYDGQINDPQRIENKGPIGRILLQLVNENELKIELQDGNCTNPNFQNPTVYNR